MTEPLDDARGEPTELHRQAASMFFCWPTNAIDLAKKDSDLPELIEKLARFIAAWERKGHQRFDAVNVGLRQALERSVVAIDDWLNTYAPDLCDVDRGERSCRSRPRIWNALVHRERSRTKPRRPLPRSGDSGRALHRSRRSQTRRRHAPDIFRWR